MIQLKPLQAALLIALATTSTSAQTDRVRTLSGSETGKVVEASPLAVKLDRNGREQSIAVSDIRSVQFGDEPSALTQARSNAISGAYQKALGMLEEIKPGDLRGDWVKQELAYYQAYCAAKLALLGEGSPRDAGMMLGSFVRANGDSFHRLEAEELLGDLLSELGQYAAAQKQYEKLARTPWPSYKIRAAMLLGQTLQAQGKHAEAVQRFDQALAIKDDSPHAVAQRQAASLAKAVSLSATGNVDQGAQLVRGVIADADPAEKDLLASAYNALGGCYVKAGRAKDALFAYLHVDLLYPTQPNEHSEALYHLAKLWDEVGKSDEARQARQTLKSQYASTEWAKK